MSNMDGPDRSAGEKDEEREEVDAESDEGFMLMEDAVTCLAELRCGSDLLVTVAGFEVDEGRSSGVELALDEGNCVTAPCLEAKALDEATSKISWTRTFRWLLP